MEKVNLHCGNGKRRDLDFYPTPPEATIALLDFMQFDSSLKVWEPACGNGAMIEVLNKYFWNVVGTDISKGDEYNFLGEIKLDADIIITNPPFNLSQAFIEKSVENYDIVAFLLKSQYWHSKKRYNLFHKQRPAYILPLTWRPNFSGKGSPVMEVLWTVWIKGDTETKYIPLLKPDLSNGKNNL